MADQPLWQFCVIFLVFGLTSTHALADGCGAMLRQHRATDMSLSYEEFDQTPGKGFRALAIAGCNAEAANSQNETFVNLYPAS